MCQPIISVGLICSQLLTTSLVVGFARGESPLRLGGILPMLLAAYLQLSHQRVHHPIATPFLGAASVFLVIMYIDVAVLSRWTFHRRGPTSSLGGLDPTLGHNEKPRFNSAKDSTSTQSTCFAARLRFGLEVALQSRFPRTPWVTKNTPEFPELQIPSRLSFLVRGAVNCAFYTFLLRLSGSLGDSSQNAVLFSSANIPLIGVVIHPDASLSTYIDVAQLGTRALGVIGYWTVQYLIISLLYDALGIICVALHITNVDVWPPVFGPFKESWSVRQFWGIFYHQLIRRGCSSVAHFITYPCLRLPKGGPMTRYVFMALVFAVSAAFHLLSDIALGIPVNESGALFFFCSQTPAIMVEDATQTLFRRLTKVSLRGRTAAEKANVSYGTLSLPVRALPRLLGYLWVVIWLTCTSPVWIYPAMQRDTGVPLIPF